MLHYGRGHTGGDAIIYFPALKVIHTGDLFLTNPPQPFIDYAQGGSAAEWTGTLDQTLKLDFDVAVPSTGPTVSRAQIEAFKAKIDTLVSRASALVNTGLPKDELMSRLRTDDLGWQLKFTPDQVDRFYAELSQREATPQPGKLSASSEQR